MGPTESHEYQIWYKHYDDERFTVVTNKKDIASEVQALVDSPGVEDVAVFEVSTTVKNVSTKLPKPSEGSQAHLRSLTDDEREEWARAQAGT